MNIRRRTLRVAIPTIVACGALAAIAVAAGTTTTSSGTSQLQMLDAGDIISSSTNSSAWIPVPGATSTVTVPSRTTRLINARFTAESRCTGGAAPAWCPVRITARLVSPFASPVELDPKSGTNFAFDSVPAGVGGNDYWEGNAMERSARLDPGTYSIVVWYCVNPTSATTFDLDDWHLAVEVSA